MTSWLRTSRRSLTSRPPPARKTRASRARRCRERVRRRPRTWVELGLARVPRQEHRAMCQDRPVPLGPRPRPAAVHSLVPRCRSDCRYRGAVVRKIGAPSLWAMTGPRLLAPEPAAPARVGRVPEPAQHQCRPDRPLAAERSSSVPILRTWVVRLPGPLHRWVGPQAAVQRSQQGLRPGPRLKTRWQPVGPPATARRPPLDLHPELCLRLPAQPMSPVAA